MKYREQGRPRRNHADADRHSPRRSPAKGFFVFFLCAWAYTLSLAACATGAASAEEYYSIGMAYYEMGKFDEAEKWLNRAKSVRKTMVASEYNLGRIAFETQRYPEAAGHFEAILRRDPNNVLALKAAAYTRIKTGDIDQAEQFYRRVLSLEPESADDGYNYALVLYAMEKYAEAEKALAGYAFALMDNNDVMLLYARSQKAQGKVEALDSYAKWLQNNSDYKVRYEYAQMLETQELYARALEEYRAALSGASGSEPSRAELRFSIARLLLIADSDNPEGISELEGAVNEGYNNIDAMEKLLADGRLSAASRERLTAIINDARLARNAAGGGAN